MSPGVLLSLLAYALFSCSDAIIKGFSGTLSIFEIGFFTTLFSLVPGILSKPRKMPWRTVFHLEHFWLVQLRGGLGVLASGCVIYAFTHIPMAEVYSIGFLTPIFITALSALILKEAVPALRWLLLVASLIGVLIVVRPGFQDVQLGHLAILFAAFCSAVCTLVLRVVAPTENRLSILGIVVAYSLCVNGTVMVVTGLSLPSLEQLALLAVIGILGGTGHLLFISATSLAPANRVAPAQYSQLLWGTLLAGLFYAELPDFVAVLGFVLLAGAGILNVLSEEACARVISRFGIAFGRFSLRRKSCPAPAAGPVPLEP